MGSENGDLGFEVTLGFVGNLGGSWYVNGLNIWDRRVRLLWDVGGDFELTGCLPRSYKDRKLL